MTTVKCPGCSILIRMSPETAANQPPCPKCGVALVLPVPPRLRPKPVPPPLPTRRLNKSPRRKLLAVTGLVAIGFTVAGATAFFALRPLRPNSQSDSSHRVLVAGVPGDVKSAVRASCPFDFSIDRAERLPIKGTRGTTLGEVGEDVLWQQKWLDENDPIDANEWHQKHNDWMRGVGPKPERKTPPRPPAHAKVRIDGVYMLEVSYVAGGELYKERYVVYRKAGGGTDLVFDVKPWENWKEMVRGTVEPE